MTRTARSTHPRAIVKDRSENRTGIEGSRRSMPKDGAGGHNWGSLADERENELAALEDASLDEEEAGATRADMPEARQATLGNDPSPTSSPAMSRSPSATMSAQEIEEARKLRTHAFKKNEIDLAAIARSSAAVSRSP